MNERADNFMKRALRTLKTGHLAHDDGDYNSAIDRAYYAAFYAVSASLLIEGIECKTHSGLIAEFAKTYVKTGILSADMGTLFARLERLRSLADYTDDELPYEKSEDALSMAQQMIEGIQLRIGHAFNLGDETANDNTPGPG